MAHGSGSMEQRSSFPARLLYNRNFLLLWIAYGISAFGDHLSEQGLLKMQNALDPSVTDVTRRNAIMLFAFMFPFFSMGPIFGWLADRVPRRAIMIFADLIRGVIMIEMFAILTGLHHRIGGVDAQPISIYVAILPLLLLGLFAAMFSPARLALLPTLVRSEQLVRANASTAGLGMIASIASFYVGGYLVEHYAVAANFRLDAATFAASAICIAMIRPSVIHAHKAGEQGLQALGDAFRYVRRHRRVAEIIAIVTIFWAAASVVRSIVPALVKTVFGGSYTDIGLYQGLLGVGLLAGSLVLTALGSALRSELAISWALKLSGVCGLVLSCAVYFVWDRWVCATAITLIGFFGAGIQVSANALLQRIVPDGFRGRVFGVTDLFSMSGFLMATGLLGIPHWPNIDRHIAWITGITSLALFITGVLTTVVRLRRGRFGRAITFWTNLNEFYCRFWQRVRRDGICTVPAEGPVIIAANHVSTLDPFLLTATSPNRYVSFMIAREFARLPFFSRLVEMIECVPVNRTGNDIASIKAALRHLEQGRCLGIFPEGRIRAPNEPLKVRDGVGMLALRSGATVVPAFISGTTQPFFAKRSGLMDAISVMIPFLRRHHARVRYGPPIDLSAWRGREKDRDAHREASELIMSRVETLCPL